MKKLLVGVIAAFMMAASLVAVSGSTATAKDCGYQGCLPTDTQVNAQGKRKNARKGPRIVAKASVSSGNVRVNQGRLKIQVKGEGRYRQAYGAAPKMRKVFKIRPGIYLVQAKYIPDRSRFNRSAESTIAVVPKRRRR